MARRLRIWEKKRGARSTGSSAVGTAGEIAFFSTMLIAGVGAILCVLFIWMVPKWRSYHNFVEVQGEVVETGVGRWPGPGVTTYRPEIRMRYEADGEVFEEWTYDMDVAYSGSETDAKEIIRDYKIGDTHRCFYDPADPQRVRMSSGSKWSFWLLMLVPASFTVIGGVGLGYTIYLWTVSAERRSASARRINVGEGPGDADAPGSPLPYVPSAGDLTNSPGIELAYRLPSTMKPVWQVFWLSAFCVLWNAIAVVFVVLAIRGMLGGAASATLAVVALAFLATGISSVYYLVRQTLATSGVGPTRIEISDHPLKAGGTYDVFLSQAGGREIESLDVSLVCDEVTTYRQGTDTRTETRRVYEQPVLANPRVSVAKGKNFEARKK